MNALCVVDELRVAMADMCVDDDILLVGDEFEVDGILEVVYELGVDDTRVVVDKQWEVEEVDNGCNMV